MKSDVSGVDLAKVKISKNPFDEISVEEAIRLKETGKAEEIVVISISPAILDWVGRFNNRRLPEPIGNAPPEEA